MHQLNSSSGNKVDITNQKQHKLYKKKQRLCRKLKHKWPECTLKIVKWTMVQTSQIFLVANDIDNTDDRQIYSFR